MPDGKALVLAMEFSGAIRYYTGLTAVRWDLLTPEAFATLRTKASAKGDRVLGIVFPHEANRAAAAAPGEWRLVEKVGLASIWELPPSVEPKRE